MKGANTMKLTDGKKTIDIQMKVWDKYDGGYGPDWSRDFFDAGCLPVSYTHLTLPTIA